MAKLADAADLKSAALERGHVGSIPAPGTTRPPLGVALIILSNLFYAYGESLIAAFLPELSRPDALGRVSGWGWSFGYFGGMLTLGLSLAYVLIAQAHGEPASHFVPVTMAITAVI